jgi:hypothetical protein
MGNELSPLTVKDFYTEQQVNASKSVISVKKTYPQVINNATHALRIWIISGERVFLLTR